MSPLSRDTVLFALACHVGEENGVHASELVVEICGSTSAAMERQLREQIEELRRAGQHICGHPSSGYYIAATDVELLKTVKFLHDRAMTSLDQAAAMQRVSLPDLRQQLRIPLESPQAVSQARPDQPAVSDNNTGSQSLAETPPPEGDLAPTPDARDGD